MKLPFDIDLKGKTVVVTGGAVFYAELLPRHSENAMQILQFLI